MELKNVRIKNFKGIDDWHIQFARGFNLIKGSNGKGKTSVLEAIAVGLGGFVAGLDGVGTRHFSQYEIRSTYERSGEGSCIIHDELPIEVSLTALLQDEKFTWSRSRSSRRASRTTVQPREISRRAWLMANDTTTILPIICYQGASRMWEQKRQKSEDLFSRKRSSRTVGYTDALLEASNIKLLLNWCVKMELVTLQKKILIPEYEAVKRAVSDFMKYMNDGAEYEVFYDNQVQELMYQENNFILPVSNLSAGYQSLIWMVFDIAYRMAVLNPFLMHRITDTNGVVLIDELDMHLHPKWQWKIINALRKTFPNVQFIAATHAPILFASDKNVWLIDIEDLDVKYELLHYGIDVNTALQRFQGDYVLPMEIKNEAKAFYDAMDAENYHKAKKILDNISRNTAPEFPLVADMKAMYAIETGLTVN